MAIRLMLAVITITLVIEQCLAGGHHGGHHKKVIIHVPYKVKHIHHTHTVYKHVKKGGEDHDYYKVIGYSGGIDKGILGVSHGHEGGGGGGGEHGGHKEQHHELAASFGGHSSGGHSGGELSGLSGYSFGGGHGHFGGGDFGGHLGGGGDIGGHHHHHE